MKAAKRNAHAVPDLSHFPQQSFSPLDLRLDPDNPRLSPEERGAPEPELLDIMIRRFSAEEVAESIIARGYIPFDPLIAWQAREGVTVREGNRRVAALKLLLNPDLAPLRFRATWKSLAQQAARVRSSFQEVTVTIVPDPNLAEVLAYIGFRHVAGNLQWPAFEKAAHIAYLLDDQKLSYRNVGRQIGSRADAVERHYVAYRLVQQAKKIGADGVENMEGAFGVLLRALNAPRARDFLGVTYPDDPRRSQQPCPKEKSENLRHFVRWTFGTEEHAPVVTDSRQLTLWGRILGSKAAVAYLQNAPAPRFDRALFKSGADTESVTESLAAAADRLEEAVPHVKRYKDTRDVRELVGRCADFLSQMLEYFPAIRREHHLGDADV